jgi:hypothetical protein
VNVHSKPAGDVPEAVRERLRVSVPPGLPVAEDRLRLVVWATKRSHGANVASATAIHVPQ